MTGISYVSGAAELVPPKLVLVGSNLASANPSCSRPQLGLGDKLQVATTTSSATATWSRIVLSA